MPYGYVQLGIPQELRDELRSRKGSHSWNEFLRLLLDIFDEQVSNFK